MGYFEEEHDLAQGTEIELHCGEQGWTSEVKASKTCAAGRPCFPVAYDGLSAELKDGDPILINDGLVKLEVLETPGVHGRSGTSFFIPTHAFIAIMRALMCIGIAVTERIVSQMLHLLYRQRTR